MSGQTDPTRGHGDPAQSTAERRWEERKVAILRENAHATAEEISRMIGSPPELLSDPASTWQREQRIFAVSVGHEDVYPLFQIEGHRPLPVVAEILNLLRPTLSDWEIFAWFVAPDTWCCEGQKPKDLLQHDPDKVCEAARHAAAASFD